MDAQGSLRNKIKNEKTAEQIGKKIISLSYKQAYCNFWIFFSTLTHFNTNITACIPTLLYHISKSSTENQGGKKKIKT